MLQNMSRTSINMEEGMHMHMAMNNSRESFENNFRGSFERSVVEDGRLNSFLGSTIQPVN